MTNQEDDIDGDDFELDLDVLGILRRRYHLIALGVFVGALLACLFYVKQVPVYQSNLAVLVGHRSADLNRASSSSLLEGATTIEDVILSTHMELFRSRKVIERAISVARLDRTVGEIQENLAVGRGGSGDAEAANMLTATFQDEDPEMAAKILQAVYESYFSYIDNQSRAIGSEAADLIANAQLKNEETLRRADKAYREFLASMPALVDTNQDGEASLQDVHRIRLAQIESELSETRKKLAQVRARRQTIRDFVGGRSRDEITDAEVLAILTEEELSRLKTLVTLNRGDQDDLESVMLSRYLSQQSAKLEYDKMLELSSKLSFLRLTLGGGHPSVREVENEIESLKQYVAKQQQDKPEVADDEVVVSTVDMLGHYFNVLKSDVREYEARERDLGSLAEVEAKAAKEVQMAFMEGNSLKANLDRAQARYDEVFQRLQEINLTNDYTGFSTDLLVTPSPAMLPVWPAKSKIAAIGILLGAMLGAALAMIAELLDRTFKNPEEVERVVGAPILAHLPLLKTSKLKRHVRPGSVVSPMIVAFHAPRSSEAETFRVLRTGIIFRCKSEGKRAFMITSPSPADGKSTMIVNLAASMAQTGKRVLLVDADMRRPTVAASLGVSAEYGLVDYLKGKAGFEDVLHPCEQAGLFVCTDGSRTSQPAELLETDRFAEFMAEARSAFDVILIDTPPLLAVADPVIVSEHVDGCLLAVRVAKNNRTIVQRAAEILDEHGSRAMGVVINTQSPRSGDYGYSSYNYYGKKENGYVASYRRYYAASDVADEETPVSSSARLSAAKLRGVSGLPAQEGRPSRIDVFADGPVMEEQSVNGHSHENVKSGGLNGVASTEARLSDR
ncbi:GumC family protein [Rhodopirellula sallentina]|uniref:non-specific protein-tyrosine kinase n=1 Tax=Rhodopirellula sallentina SM41 TaxID=1263870 RepID=M5UQ35_9BACT|nr:polysaccharide biosynthesis tyrosine autokinase [Rhodopirellula sallentina]EMI58103.1 Exopolysaccharide synthesis protein [Rhodopirellula sallentina SM41]